MLAAPATGRRAAASLQHRNALAEQFFGAAAAEIATTARDMATRFERGGRLIAFGQGAAATDAQHVAVEFVHPVIVGKRALPAFDASALPVRSVQHLLGEDDMLIAVSLPGDRETEGLLQETMSRGIMTIAPLGSDRTRAPRARVGAPFVLQEWAETYYHTLWETVHVFLERSPRGQDVGSAAFLYPFLGAGNTESPGLLADVVASIHAKVADDAALRSAVAASQGDTLAAAARVIATSVARGGTLLAFGNGGSATDANDFAFDCLCPPPPMAPFAAMSLAADAATATAIANDVGTELIFVRQLIAHGRAGDVAFAISTSGGSRNVIAALHQARADGLATIALLGYDGGEIARQGLADIAIVVGSDYIPRIQEVQASIYHVIRELAAACGDGAY